MNEKWTRDEIAMLVEIAAALDPTGVQPSEAADVVRKAKRTMAAHDGLAEGESWSFTIRLEAGDPMWSMQP